MKLGLLSAILGELSFEEMISYAAQVGYQCVEVACWPKGKAERKYAGVTHIDVDDLDENKAKRIIDYCDNNKVELSAISYYGNPLHDDQRVRQAAIDHIHKLIRAASLLGVKYVGSFIGRSQAKTVEENFTLFLSVWPKIIEAAEQHGVSIVIENCPMLFTEDEWPGGQNLATTPHIWRQMFECIPSKNFGLNYDPSHFVWLGMDYIKPLYEFKDKIYHLHFKDIKLYRDHLNDVGIMSYPLSYMAPKLPGLGDIDWSAFISALYDISFDGPACIEIEDTAFEGSLQYVKKAVELSYDFMRRHTA